MFWRLLPVEEVERDRCGHGEVVSDAVVDFMDRRGFDSFEAVEEAVEADEGVVVLDADSAVVDFRIESVFVEYGADLRLSHDEADDVGEVVDGFHCLAPFRVVSIFLIDVFIIS